MFQISEMALAVEKRMMVNLVAVGSRAVGVGRLPGGGGVSSGEEARGDEMRNAASFSSARQISC